MACAPCGPVKEVEDLNLMRARNWPEQWVLAAAPGDLMLLDGAPGQAGGVLRLRFPGVFIVLSAAQVWKGEPVTWPVADSPIKKFRIVGRRIHYILA